MSHYDKKERRTSFIFIIIFILLVAGISISGYLSYRNFEQQFRDQAGRQLSSIAELKMNELVDWRRGRMADANMLYQSQAFATLVQAYFEGPNNDLAGEQIQDWLKNYQENSEYDHVRLLDAKGQTHLSYPIGLPALSPVVAERVPEVLQSKQMMLFDFYRRDNDQNIRLSLLVPIMDVQTGQQVIGLVAISIDPKIYLYPFIENWPIDSSTAETLLIRRDGNDALFLNELRFDPNAALTLRFPLIDTELPAVKAALGQSGIVQGVDYRGKTVLADVRAVPESPWFLVSKVDIAEVNAPLTARLWQTFFLAGISIFAMGAGLMTVWRQQRVQFYRTQADAAEAVRKSEKKYRALIENMQVGVVVHAPDTSILLSNPIASELLGLTTDQMQGKTAIDPAWSFLREDGTRMLLEEYPVNRALASETPISNLILGILRPDREVPNWVQCDIHQDRDPNGNLQQIVVTFLDITQRKLVEESLRESEDSLQLAILAGRMGIWNKNFVSGKLEWSLECKAMFGIPPETEMNDELFMNALHPEDRQPTNLAIREALEKQTNFNIEYRVIWPDGSLHWIAAQGHGYYDQNGQALRMDGLTFDITERKRAAEFLQEYNNRLEIQVDERTRELRDTQEKLVRQERLAMLGQLAGSIGHELRNPLGVISNAIYFLKMAQPNASDQVKEYLTIIENEARTSDKIVTDLLDFTRIKSVEQKNVSVSEMISQTLNRFPAPPSIEVTLDIPSDLPFIFADPHHVIQILGNLTVNAYQSMDSNGGRVEISAASHSDMVSIAVHDNGAGILAENIKKLFEPLFTTKTKGIGLGLAVSQKLAEANGGRIEVESEAGLGSTFTVWLPVK